MTRRLGAEGVRPAFFAAESRPVDDATRRLEPTAFALGAWVPETMGGPAVVAAAAHVLEGEFGDPEFLPARLTVDLFSAVRFAPLELRTTQVRAGRRIRVADAVLVQGDRTVARASAVFLRQGEQPPGQVWRSGRQIPVPDAAREVELGPEHYPLFGSDGSGWSDDMGAHQGGARKRLWQHPMDVVEGVPASPFQRAAVLAESTSLVTNWGTEGIGFINADLTVTLARLPVSGDFGLEADEHTSAAGVAVGTATLYDREGAFGAGVVVAVSNAQRQIDFSGAFIDERIAQRTRPEQ